jgi:hypothetical protein
MASIRVRMYRTGFGDCFLLSFGGRAAQHVLIDFGVHQNGDIGQMDKIMDDIEKVTKKKLALVVATHAHRDHISGFGDFAERFAEFEIGQVWLPWTDDPNDKQARTLQKKQLALYDRLHLHLTQSLGARKPNPQEKAALNALANLRGNAPATTALSRGFNTSAKVRYLEAGAKVPKVGGIEGLSARILAPSRDKTFLSRMNPPKEQRFLTAPGDQSGVVRPFPSLELKPDVATTVKDQPIVGKDELDALNEIAEAPADRLALALDNVRNNTSLVILFRYKDRTLLFPGDAQWGSWQSWIGTDSGRDALADLDFIKVGHHGSHNATPVDAVGALKAKGVVAMVSTQTEPFPTIPRLPLLDSLRDHGKVIRSDWVTVAGAPKGPKFVSVQGVKRGDLCIQYDL